MFKYYLTTITRNLLRHKLYSTINIGGLALGLAACWLILLFVRSEMGYDSWIPQAERIHRLHTSYFIPGRAPLLSTRSGGPMAQAVKSSFEEVEQVTRAFYFYPRVSHEGAVYQQVITMVDEGFFEVFDLPLLEGSRETALRDNQSLIISDSTAKRYFGEESAIGQTLEICCSTDDNTPTVYRITGVMADTPDNTHFFHDAIALIDEIGQTSLAGMYTSWTSVNMNTYVKMAEGKDVSTVVDRFPWFLDEVVPIGEDIMKNFGMKTSEFAKLSLMPIEDIHLNASQHSGDLGDIRPLGNKALIINFMLIALLILGIATVNFLNLTTARFGGRAREVSMRKVMGASRKSVALQFLGETIAASLLALLVSIFLVMLVLPWFNQILSSNLQLDLFGSNTNLLILLLITTMTGVIGGSYPSFYVSRLRPAKVLGSSRSADGSTQGWMKNVLVVFQFSISIALITAAAVTWLQTDYARSADLGYERENRIVLNGLRSGGQDAQESLMARIREVPGVIGLARSSEVPSSSLENNTSFTILGREQEVGSQLLNYISADHDYFELYGIEPLVGRVFSEEFGADRLQSDEDSDDSRGSMVLNESAARRLNFAKPEDALGQIVTTETFGGLSRFEVVGVIPDINNRSAHYESIPSVYWLRDRGLRRLTIHFEGVDQQAIVEGVESAWREMMPTVPFSYSILEEMVDRLYLNEERQVMTFTLFALLAIVISGLGLYAMASITVLKRTREIGLRKVMGARVVDLIRLLLWQFSKPVVLANLLAWPVTWYFLNNWLDGFVYRIDLNPLFFLVAGIAALLIAWSTVIGHAWHVAQKNPIHALRYE